MYVSVYIYIYIYIYMRWLDFLQRYPGLVRAEHVRQSDVKVVCVHMYIYIYMYVCMYIYIYIYIPPAGQVDSHRSSWECTSSVWHSTGELSCGELGLAEQKGRNTTTNNNDHDNDDNNIQTHLYVCVCIYIYIYIYICVPTHVSTR